MIQKNEFIQVFPLGLHSIRYNTYVQYDKRNLLFSLGTFLEEKKLK